MQCEEIKCKMNKNTKLTSPILKKLISVSIVDITDRESVFQYYTNITPSLFVMF